MRGRAVARDQILMLDASATAGEQADITEDQVGIMAKARSLANNHKSRNLWAHRDGRRYQPGEFSRVLDADEKVLSPEYE
jgi:hypothetical protein